MSVHFFVDFAVEPIIDLVVRLIWFEYLAHMRHGSDGGFKIGVQTEAHGGIYGCAEPRCFIDVGPGGGQAEDIRRRTHGVSALRAAAGYAEAGDGDMGPFLYPLFPLSEGIPQSLQDGPVKMSLRVHIAEADDGSLGLRSGEL